MTNRERAEAFVRKYPLMFNDEGSVWFWVDVIEQLLDEANKDLMNDIREQKREGVEEI